ncbi:exodeoxyribonuclease V subunit gamma [Marinobacterium arenosum]|uniref:exodeoxyribonuclease V subunit gamma n=1 Tax=Marinobacterium arenosum TaxID=2862496 RepID=UPI001C94F87F|nr:exodeoxyribonuclease V subunit gamma [Marinobacterium arenosum]MBY4678198.1 exodeoxyribonuclease V subunit gamma [Marinobacterium arenosum]
MFQIYHSNALDLLKDLLVQVIARQPLTDPFVRETILVQSPGMAQWLKLELAESLGIAASIDFPLPASFLWQQFAAVLDGVPERSAFDKEAMSWKLMELLPQQLDDPAFAPLRQYLEDDDQGVKRYQLAAKVADIFDQYLMYRPDWIEDWQQGGDLGAAEQPWQPILWRALQARTEALGQPHWHRANMLQAFTDALMGAGRSGQLPERLFIFGISALPQHTLEALRALGQRTDVHLMIANPCRYYWGEILDSKQIARINRRWFDKPGVNPASYFEQGNPLLASMGKLGRDYLYLLQSMGVEEIDLFVPPEGDNLLAALQRDILNLEDRSRLPSPPPERSDYKTTWRPEDDSLVLHSCHSPLREVEVLHDQLLAMFADDGSLSPRDVIVMMPDVAAYAPYIEAVFGNAPKERRIPYSISDRSLQQESPLLQNFLRLLALPDSRLPVSEVLELLELPAVMRRFELDQEAFDLLRHWIEQVQIRWGLDADDRAALELPAFAQNSWRFGLDRMLAGYALGEQEGPWQQIAPYGDVEGLDAAILGRLADFIDLLRDCCTLFQGRQPLAEWGARINQLLARAYLPDDSDEAALSEIRKVLERLQQQHSDAAFDESLDAVILRDYLNDALSQQRASQRFMIGAVNFCTLMPMRSIPFRVVCLLGMNDGVYPRSMPPLGFDLMNSQPRRGDRSRRDDDRYLFLEALLAARQRFYISYIGRAIQDNREKVPSVLVNELLDYCADSFVRDGDQPLAPDDSGAALRQALVCEHPLTPFSPSYFDTDSRLFSYAAEWLPVAGAEQQPQPPFQPHPLPLVMPEELELAELLRFFRNPAAYFFRERLKVVFDPPAQQSEDEEPFSVAGLDDYLIKQRYLQAALAGQPLEPIDQLLQAEGLLPLGSAGQQRLAKLRRDSSELAEKLAPWCEGPRQRLEIRLTLKLNSELEQTSISLTGWLDDLYGGRLVRYRPSQLQGRDRLLCWLEHLVYCAQYPVAEASVYRGLSGHALFQPLAPSEAQAELQRLLAFWQQGLTRPLPFDPQTGWAYIANLPKGEERAKAEADKRFSGGFNSHGVVEDPYISRVYPVFRQYWPGLQRCSDELLPPMVARLEESQDD